MEKRMVFLLLLVLASLIPLTSAQNLEITKFDRGSAVISELANPAVFDFVIKNNGPTENYELYTLVGVSMSPRSSFELLNNTSTTIQVRAYPDADQRKLLGSFTFEYQMKGDQSGIFKDKLTVQIVSLKSVLSVDASDVSMGDEEAQITVKNLQNTHIENLAINFKSAFFDSTKVVSIGPYGEQNISVRIDQSELNKLPAGDYVFSAIADPENSKVTIEGTLKYLEKEGVVLNKTSSGFIIRKTTLTRTNEGNVPSEARISISKDVLSRLFTTYSVDPMDTKRSGLVVEYDWQKQLAPGESFSVTATTNFTLPFILIILVIVITFLVKVYTQTGIIVTKRVSFVKTSGDVFALKVRIHVKAKKHADDIQIIDRVPAVAKLYEKFGVMPDKVDESTRRLFWRISSLNAGEERVFSYVIYSKIKVVGRFELPPVTAIYQAGDKTLEVFSNRAFFVADTAIGPR